MPAWLRSWRVCSIFWPVSCRAHRMGAVGAHRMGLPPVSAAGPALATLSGRDADLPFTGFTAVAHGRASSDRETAMNRRVATVVRGHDLHNKRGPCAAASTVPGLLAHRWKGRIFFAFADQGLYSASNFLLTILYASWLPLDAFGRYVVIWTVSLFIEAIQISLVVDFIAGDREPLWPPQPATHR